MEAPRPPFGDPRRAAYIIAAMAHVSLQETQARFERALAIAERATWVPIRPERPEKGEGGVRFQLASPFEPRGDQPQAIAELVEGVRRNEKDQVLLGVTGSGKTYTMAHVIASVQKPT